MSEVQSVVFERNKWTVPNAKEWLKQNQYKTSFRGKGVDKKETQLRFRQTAPKQYTRYTSKKLKGGVMLVIGYK